MSRTLAEAEQTVRYHLRDRNPQSEAFSSPEYVRALQSGVRLLAPQLLLGETETTALVTTTDGTKDYPLPGTQGYASLYQLRSQNDGLIVPIVSMGVLEQYRQADTGVVTSPGQPVVAALFESISQVTTIRFWPTPGSVIVFDGWHSKLPAAFYTAGSGALAALPDSTTIPFDDSAFEGLCFTVAALLFKRMPDDKKSKLGLAPTAADDWPGLAATQIKASRLRTLRLGRSQSTHVTRSRKW